MDIEFRIARTEREYERVANAVFIVRSRAKSLATDRDADALQLARAQAELARLEKHRSSLRVTLDELEMEAERGTASDSQSP